MMSPSSLLLLLLEEFWHSLTAVEQAQYMEVKIYDSPNLEERKDLNASLQCKGIFNLSSVLVKLLATSFQLY